MTRRRLMSDADALRAAAPSSAAPSIPNTRAAARTAVTGHPTRCAGMLGGKHHLTRYLRESGGDARP